MFPFNLDPTEYPVHISRDLVVHAPALIAGQFLADRYEVGERIGGGGMADVFRGRDIFLCRDVAIKVIKPGMASDELCARMLQEGRAAAALDHPHLLRVLDLGRIEETRTARESFYLITELLRGESLGERLRRLPDGRMPWRRAVELLLPALAALEQVHQHHYIHRDLKPDNLYLHRRDDVEAMMVLDLGLAKLAPAQRGAEAPVRTETGRVLGTPAYMSPEQAGGYPLDHRTDIYSIGVTLHRMLAGRLPFEARPGDSPIVLMAHHLYDAPPRISDELVPPRLADVVLRALAKAPAERPQTMLELAGDLADCLGPSPTSTHPPKFERSTSVHRVGRVFGGMAVLGALVASQSGDLVVPAAASAPTSAATLVAPPTSPAPPATHCPAAPGEPNATDMSNAPGASEEAPAHAALAPVVLAEFVTDTPATAALALAAPAEPTTDAPAHSALASTAPAGPSPRTTPPRSAPRRPAAVTRVFAAIAGEVAQCMRDHGSLEPRAVTVALHVRPDGSVTRPVVHDSSAAQLCVRPLLARLRFAPGPAQQIVHTYQASHGGTR